MMGMISVWPIIAGMVLSVCGLAILAILSRKTRAAAVFGALVAMVAIYVGLAIPDDASAFSTSAVKALAVQIILALGFFFAGLAALRSANKQWLLGVLILLHGGIDLIHLVIDQETAPDFYALACLIFDASIGAAAVRLLSQPRPV